jgi:hypothetical protein
MPLKDGSLPTDKEVDISAASQADLPTCNKLLCKLGYSREDDVRYPKILQKVFGRLRTEENGDGNAAQQRHLYKKLSHCKDNYPDVESIPTKNLCKMYNGNTSSSSYSPQSNYRPPQPPQNASKTEKPSPSDDQLKAAIQQHNQMSNYINGPFHTEVSELYKKVYALDRLASVTNDLIWKTNDSALKKKMNGLRVDLIGITGYISRVSDAATLRALKSNINAFDSSFDKFIKQHETKQRKNAPKPPKASKPPKTAKVPKSPKARKGPKTAKAPTPPPRANSSRKRCPNGRRRNKKTGNCDPK